MVLSGEKRLLRQNQVLVISSAERFPELSIANLLDYCQREMRDAFQYIPDDAQEQPAKVDRLYLLNVV